MPDLKSVISHGAVAEYALITGLCLIRFREIVREVGPDQFPPGKTGDPDRCFVYVADSPVRVNGDQRVQACLDQAPVICTRFLERRFGLLPFRDIDTHLEDH